MAWRVWQLAGPARSQRVNRHLAYHLAWTAGVLNSVGFVAVGFYTSHMTGITASVADHLVLGGWAVVAVGLLALVAFLLGAMACAVQFHWARRRERWHDRRFALVLLTEALLVLLIGAVADLVPGPQRQWPLVAALGFVMGLQNALITKVSEATIRTTHVTGMVTDIGIELGKGLYRNRLDGASPVRADLERLHMHGALVGLFFLGGVMGALGYLASGVVVLLVPAALLLTIAVPPLLAEPGATRP
ncbi:MAG TPA: YoaK family protein [Ornithinimicrobium sp.]|nr:YoaK family protein [Ornithinimicrobium sp.]